MFSLYTQHTPEKILELQISVAEKMHDLVGDSLYEFFTVENGNDLHAYTGTIGAVRHQLPDFIFGGVVPEKSMAPTRLVTMVFYSYLNKHRFTPLDGDLDTKHFYQFVVDNFDPVVARYFSPNHRIHFRKIDAQRWFMGMGWEQNIYYNQDEKDSAVVIQLLEGDENGRICGEEGFTGVACELFDRNPFGTREPRKQSPLSKYLN